MKRLLVVAALAVGVAACGQNYLTGLSAYTRGDYAAALRKWQSAALQSDARAPKATPKS